MFDEKLKAFATARQRELMEAVETYGSAKAASKILNLADTTISPMPGTDPLMLQETDRAALTALEIATGRRPRCADAPRRP